MKRLLFFFAAVLLSLGIYAQDVIYRSTNDSIKAKVLTVNNSEVTYRLTGYEDGPLFTAKTSDIVAIRYANGTHQYFADSPTERANAREVEKPASNHSSDKKGHFFLGGTAEIGYTGAFQFALEPVFGYEFNDRIAIGTGIGPIVVAGKGTSAVMGIVEPFIRLCAWHNDIVFIDFKATAGIGFTDIMQMCQVGVRPSLRVRITEHFEMSADIGLFGAQYTYGAGWVPAIGVGATSAGLWFTYRF